MALFYLFLSSYLVAFSGAMVPGPLFTVTVDGALRRGFSAGPLLAAGHAFLELLLLGAMVWGLDSLVVLPGVKETVALAGGLYLIWMAWGILRDAKGMRLDFARTGTEAGAWGLFGKGILVSLAGPYFAIWWATIGLTYMGLSLQQGYGGLAAFFSGHALADFSVLCAVSYLVGRGRHRFSLTVYRSVLAVCGIFLLFLGGYFLYLGLAFYLGGRW